MGTEPLGPRGHQPCARDRPEARFHLTPPTMPSPSYHPTYVSVGVGEGLQWGATSQIQPRNMFSVTLWRFALLCGFCCFFFPNEFIANI